MAERWKLRILGHETQTLILSRATLAKNLQSMIIMVTKDRLKKTKIHRVSEGENDSASETEGNGPDEEAQNNFEGREDNDRDVTSTETQDDGNEEISNEEEGRDASLTETQGESDEETSGEEDENLSRESVHQMIENDQDESAVFDAENPGQGESSEPEASSTVKTDDIAALRSQVFALEQIVREKDEQIRHKDKRIAELEDEVAELKKSYEYNEFESMAI